MWMNLIYVLKCYLVDRLLSNYRNLQGFLYLEGENPWTCNSHCSHFITIILMANPKMFFI